MASIREYLVGLELDDWVVALTGLAAIVTAVLDFTGLLPLTTDRLLQMAIAALGIMMASVVIQAKRQDKNFSQLARQLEKTIGGVIDFEKFASTEFGVGYMASRVRTATSYIDHVSLSPSIPRWHNALREFEKAVEDIASSNQVKIRYVANFSDAARLKRVQRILSNPDVHRYYAASFNPENIVIPPIGFMVIDGLEVTLAIPCFGEEAAILTIRNSWIASTFEAHFNLLWSQATPFDRTQVTTPTMTDLQGAG